MLSCWIRKSVMASALCVTLAGLAEADEETRIGPMSVTSGALTVSFASAEDGYAVTGIVNRLGQDARFVRSHAESPDFWQLSFVRRDATGTTDKVFLDNRVKARCKAVVREDGVVFKWMGIDLCNEPGAVDVAASVVRSKTVPNGCEWRLQVKNRSSRYVLLETIYPCLTQVVAPHEADVLIPSAYLGAKLMKSYVPAEPVESWHPGWYASVAAYMKNGVGLYLAAHDSDSRIKRMTLDKDLNASFLTPVERTEGGVVQGPCYPVVTAAFEGDWWMAAGIYRSWAKNQKWMSRGPLATRSDCPTKFAETHGWLFNWTWYGAAVLSNFLDRVSVKWPGKKLGVEIGCWHKLPFDNGYPEMLPMQDFMDKVIGYGESKGLTIMPYTNGRLWDTKMAAYPYVEPDAVHDIGVKPVTEQYGLNRFAVMCPGAAGWQKALSRNTANVVAATGASAVYLDQIACATPIPCYNPAHGHALGGGSWWADGYRKLLVSARQDPRMKGVAITSEGASETWLDVIDGYLLACCPYQEDVPFYTAVYGGYATYFGSYQREDTPFDAFFAVQARALLWGVSPGWLHSWPVEDKNARAGNAWADLARIRERGKEFFVYGHPVGEVKFGETPEMFTCQFTESMAGQWKVSAHFPVVMGLVWKNVDDSKSCMVIANLTGVERNVVALNPFRRDLKLSPYSVVLVGE